jgi:hypothetical protein
MRAGVRRSITRNSLQTPLRAEFISALFFKKRVSSSEETLDSVSIALSECHVAGARRIRKSGTSASR